MAERTLDIEKALDYIDSQMRAGVDFGFNIYDTQSFLEKYLRKRAFISTLTLSEAEAFLIGLLVGRRLNDKEL